MGTVADSRRSNWRRPLFGRHGRKVIAGLCGYETAALAPGSPLPTITSVGDLHPWVKVVIVAALIHHFFVEE